MGWYGDNLGNGNLDGLKKVYFEGKVVPPPFYNCGTIPVYELQRLVMASTLPELAPGIYDQSLPNHVPKAVDDQHEITSLEAFQIYSQWFQWLRKIWLKSWSPTIDCDNFAKFFDGIMGSFAGWGNTAKLRLDSKPHPWDPNPVDWHAYNLIIVRQDVDADAPLLLVAYEPQNGDMKVMEKGEMISYQMRDFELG